MSQWVQLTVRETEDHEIALVIPGPLQLAILSILWRRKMVTLAGIHKALAITYKPMALSSVSTVITRLVARGWVMRLGVGRYTAAISKQGLIDLIADHIEQA